MQSVSYVSSDEIKVVLTGDVKTKFTEAYTSAELTVSSRALEGDGDSYCLVNILKPSLEVSSAIGGGTASSKTFYTTYVLPYGGFTDNATKENITLKDQTNGELSELTVSEDKKSLSVKVQNYSQQLGSDSAYPILQIPANATTFNVAVEITVGYGFASALLA